VLLPYRDVAPTIEAAVLSLLDQTLRDIEVLAVDDGSTDDGPDTVAALATGDARIRCLSTGGLGIANALNAALREARAEYVARMDGDDVSHPLRLERQLAWMGREPCAGAVGVRVQGFPAHAVGEGMLRYIDWQNGLVSPQDHMRELFVEAPLCHPSVMLRREALDDVGGWRDVPWPEDYDLWLRLDARGWALAKVPEVLFSWRHREGRATFHDPRYSLERFREVKAEHLARRIRAAAKPFAMWGAGPTGKRTARALEAHEVKPQCFIDIDPRKIGRTARGVPTMAPDRLKPGGLFVVVAVGARGARELIRAELDGRGFVEGVDYLFAS